MVFKLQSVLAVYTRLKSILNYETIEKMQTNKPSKNTSQDFLAWNT